MSLCLILRIFWNYLSSMRAQKNVTQALLRANRTESSFGHFWMLIAKLTRSRAWICWMKSVTDVIKHSNLRRFEYRVSTAGSSSSLRASTGYRGDDVYRWHTGPNVHDWLHHAPSSICSHMAWTAFWPKEERTGAYRLFHWHLSINFVWKSSHEF